MSKTKITRPSEERIAMIIQRERMPETGAYGIVMSNSSSMDDPSAHVIYYI